MKSNNSIFRADLFRVMIAPCLFLLFSVSAEASERSFCFGRRTEPSIIGKKMVASPYWGGNRQRHKQADYWDWQKAQERRREEQAKKAAEEAAKKKKEQQTLEDNRRWEEKRTELQNRFIAIDVKLVLERARSDFAISTNLFAKSPTPAFIAHTNYMVKLTKQFLDAQKYAQSCFNPNAVLSQVETNVSRYEKAHEALVKEMDSFNQPSMPVNPDYAAPSQQVFRRRRMSTVLIATNTTDAATASPSLSLSADKLRELKKLFDEGILTQEEYDAKRKELLDAL